MRSMSGICMGSSHDLTLNPSPEGEGLFHPQGGWWPKFNPPMYKRVASAKEGEDHNVETNEFNHRHLSVPRVTCLPRTGQHLQL